MRLCVRITWNDSTSVSMHFSRLIELSDIVCCSRHMEGNLSLLASAMDMTDEDMEQLKTKYKSTPGQALQLLKIWQKNIGGSRLELSKLLSGAGFSRAAER